MRHFSLSFKFQFGNSKPRFLLIAQPLRKPRYFPIGTTCVLLRYFRHCPYCLGHKLTINRFSVVLWQFNDATRPTKERYSRYCILICICSFVIQSLPIYFPICVTGNANIYQNYTIFIWNVMHGKRKTMTECGSSLYTYARARPRQFSYVPSRLGCRGDKRKCLIFSNFYSFSFARSHLTPTDVVDAAAGCCFKRWRKPIVWEKWGKHSFLLRATTTWIVDVETMKIVT